MRECIPTRIINVSSDAHRYGKLDLDDLNLSGIYTGIKAYSRSKLANLLFTYELAKRIGSENICVNALHPGHVATDIWKDGFGVFGHLMKKMINRFALTPKEGADNSIYLAVARDVNLICGKYFVGRKVVSSSAISYDSDLAKRLWEKSEELVGL